MSDRPSAKRRPFGVNRKPAKRRHRTTRPERHSKGFDQRASACICVHQRSNFFAERSASANVRAAWRQQTKLGDHQKQLLQPQLVASREKGCRSGGWKRRILNANSRKEPQMTPNVRCSDRANGRLALWIGLPPILARALLILRSFAVLCVHLRSNYFRSARTSQREDGIKTASKTYRTTRSFARARTISQIPASSIGIDRICPIVAPNARKPRNASGSRKYSAVIRATA
jgi:hypothetical protein